MALLKKGDKEKKQKKVKAPKAPKVKKNKGEKKSLFKKKNKAPVTTDKDLSEDDQATQKGKKKLSKKALIVTIAVILIVVIAVVVVVILFPKKPSSTDENSSNSTSQSDSSSDKENSDSESTDSEGSENSDEGSSSQLVDENGVPLITDPDFNLMSLKETQAIIESQFDTTKYTVNLDEEKIVIGGKNYMSFTLSENGEQVGPPLAVNRETGEYMCFYPEKIFGDMMEYPILPLEAMDYAWNCTFERKDANDNITCIIKTKQLEEDLMHFTISSFVGDKSETLEGTAKVRDNIAVYTDGDYFRIQFVKFESTIVVTESGKNKHTINATFDGTYDLK